MNSSIYDTRVAQAKIAAIQHELDTLVDGSQVVYLLGGQIVPLPPLLPDAMAYSRAGGIRVVQGALEKQYWLYN